MKDLLAACFIGTLATIGWLLIFGADPFWTILPVFAVWSFVTWIILIAITLLADLFQALDRWLGRGD